MTPLIKSLASLTKDAAEYMWFDLAVISAYSFTWSEFNGQRLPYERCAFCGYDGKGDRFLLLAEQANENTILLSAWALMRNRYTNSPTFAFVSSYDGKGCYVANVDGEEEITKEQAAPIVGIVAEFFNRASTTGCTPTIKKCHINRTREKKGKPPLIYDWHTVIIQPPANKDGHETGTHASPRKHQRRGHWRNHPSGMRVWVRDCWVGDASKGLVFKDYEVRK